MNPRALKAIVVEDNEVLCRLFAENLRSDPLIRTAEAWTLKEGLDLAVNEPHTVLLVDLGLPDAAGTEAVPALRRAAPWATLVVITGDPGMKDDALAAGAHAVIIKGSLESHGAGLVKAVREAVVNRDLELLNAPTASRLDKATGKLEAATKLLLPPLVALGMLGGAAFAVGRADAGAEAAELRQLNAKAALAQPDRPPPAR